MSDSQAGRKWARSLGSSDVAAIMDALVLGCFDWRDWFDDHPGKAFLRAATSEIELLDEVS